MVVLLSNAGSRSSDITSASRERGSDTAKPGTRVIEGWFGPPDRQGGTGRDNPGRGNMYEPLPSYMNREVQQRRSAATDGPRLKYTSTCGDGRETERDTYLFTRAYSRLGGIQPSMADGRWVGRTCVGEAEPCCCGGWIGGAGPWRSSWPIGRSSRGRRRQSISGRLSMLAGWAWRDVLMVLFESVTGDASLSKSWLATGRQDVPKAGRRGCISRRQG